VVGKQPGSGSTVDGRSPDKGDAVEMCLAPGNAAVRRTENRSRTPKVVLGYEHTKRRHGTTGILLWETGCPNHTTSQMAAAASGRLASSPYIYVLFAVLLLICASAGLLDYVEPPYLLELYDITVDEAIRQAPGELIATRKETVGLNRGAAAGPRR